MQEANTPQTTADIRKTLWVAAFTSIAADNCAEDCAAFANEALALFDAQFEE